MKLAQLSIAPLMAASVFAAGAALADPVDLSSWSKQGPAGNGSWTVGGGGAFVNQTINGEPTFFVSPGNVINTTFQGKLTVYQSGDDDYIGFVFGYQAPFSGSTADTEFDFLLFAWKSQTQTFAGSTAEEGFTLARVDGNFNFTPSGTDSEWRPGFWDQCNQNAAHINGCAAQGYEVLDRNLGGTKGWQLGTTYDFWLTYQQNRILIDIQGGTSGDFVNRTNIFDVAGSFQTGRFGFFNYSQAGVRYEGFTQEEAPPTGIPAPAALGLIGVGLVGMRLLRRA